MQRIEAFLIDSNKLFREGLKRLLDDSPFQIVAEAGNLREGVAIAESGLRPQLVLLFVARDAHGRVDHRSVHPAACQRP
jgi:two-component system, NarL family, nitrate/nitrite response regulator NarL